MVNRKLVWTLCGAAIFMVALIQSAAAISLSDRTTYITFSRPVQLPGVELRAGTYVFERAEPFSAPSVVRVLSRDREVSYYMGHTILADRPRGLAANAVITLGESLVGAPPPVAAWWPHGDNRGHTFIYSSR